MAGKLAVGSTVQLKSGGPAMTVMRQVNSGDYQCTWFDGNSPKQWDFPADALQPVEGRGIVA
jgi:uncharacterized protein YodC (DUF2158 family)